jgi:uncharacterized protein
MLWGIPAGVLAGLVLGYLGAGGTVVGLPFLLYLASFPPHKALGTNALGVSMIALALLAWRLWNRQIRVLEGVVFAIPGIMGIYVGVQIGLIYPGRQLIFLLGILLFVVAGWLFYLSTRPEMSATAGASTNRQKPTDKPLRDRLWLMIPTAFAIGVTAGFFGIGGGFMIVPALALTGGLDLIEAAGASLISIALFAGWIGVQYWFAGSVNSSAAFIELLPGIVGGVIGIWLGQRLSKKFTQRVFAAFLVALGLYMALG